ncbi:flagellar motor switch protein FliG [Kordiimonas sp. SCSIO 12610]|uniref:flagellar motor switch protein FliG n=1 Tax=Kordiimonas sp. SCSIO 12610 TaxID=2829597 RepID=UPI00210DDB0A|nr:flagellar motor switch protein FliG [Kordiimonas sp. SCSIO 12610]UTW54535.1 flagellar motor switch protein FliG [Kordiimonas sp. SCSIO 12610]
MSETTIDLTGSQKAAAFMLAVGENYGQAIWEALSDDEIKELSQHMSNLGSVNAEDVENIFVEFASKVSTVGSLNGSYESTERLLRKMLPADRVGTIMDEIRGPAGRTMWDKLGNVNEVVLASYLKNEYPQTVAVVLQKIKAEHAARVLSVLPEDFSMEVIMRMLRMEAVQKDILDKVEQTLRIEFMNNLARTSRRDSHETIAEIFNFLDRSSEARFLSALEDRNRDSAEKIRALMFTFEDLANLDPQGVQTLLRNVDKDKLALGMKGASDTLRDLFFSNMSERAAKILREDMEAMGPVRLRDVDEAQMEMVSKAKDLAESGEILLSDNKGEDELVY